MHFHHQILQRNLMTDLEIPSSSVSIKSKTHSHFQVIQNGKGKKIKAKKN